MESLISLGSARSTAQIALLIFITSALINVFERIIRAWKLPSHKISQQATISREISLLKKEAAQMSHPDTFAQSAKASRKVVALEKELETLRIDIQRAQSHFLLKLPQILRILGMVLIVGLAFYVPVALYLPAESLWPFSRWLTFMSGERVGSGAIGLVPWSILCQKVTKSIVFYGM